MLYNSNYVTSLLSNYKKRKVKDKKNKEIRVIVTKVVYNTKP